MDHRATIKQRAARAVVAMARGVAAHMAVHGKASERQRHHAHMLAVQTQLRALHATVSDTIPLQHHRTPVQRAVLHRTPLMCTYTPQRVILCTSQSHA